MHRQTLLKTLDAYEQAWTEERETVERIRALVMERDDCFDRACRPGHVTGSAWVLSADRRRCLLVHHRKLDRWIQPGGHADGDPDPLRVAMQETHEETGLAELIVLSDAKPTAPLDVDIHIIPAQRPSGGTPGEDAHEHHDIRFLLAAANDAPLAVSGESHDVRWFSPAEIEHRIREQSVLRLLRKSRHWMIE